VVLFSHFLPTVEIKKETETNAKKKDSEQKSKSKPEGTCAIQ